MKKRSFGRQLGRNKNQRRALFRGLSINLIEKGEIITSLAKAKAIRSDLEKLITKAKNATLADRRQIFRYLGKRDLVNRLVDSIGTVFVNRQGGYLRIVRLPLRRGDAGEMVKIMLTETPAEKSSSPVKTETVEKQSVVKEEKPSEEPMKLPKTKGALKVKKTAPKKISKAK